MDICNGYATEVCYMRCGADRLSIPGRTVWFVGGFSGLWVDSLVCGWIREVGGMPERGVLTNLAANLARNLRMRPVMPGPRRIIADRAKPSSQWPTAVGRLFSPSRLIRIAAFAIFA